MMTTSETVHEMENALKKLSEAVELSKSGNYGPHQAKKLSSVLRTVSSNLTNTASELESNIEHLSSENYEKNTNIKETTNHKELNSFYGGANHYLYLTQHGKVQAEYIWIGGSGLDIRCKSRTLDKPVKHVKELPLWNYDGSSTGQAKGEDSEVWLKPIKMVPDPFRRGSNILVLCETYDADMNPLPTNKRRNALKLFLDKKVVEEKPWFGLEQEYTMYDLDGITPLGWPIGGFPAPQGPYYCGVGARKAYGRKIVEAHYRACLYCGINISGINAEVMPGQWEFQVGPCLGIDSGDQVWLARYLLIRIAEEFGVVISFNVKPVKGDWNGAGCHTNYSTKSMREKGGYKNIIEAIEKLEKNHQFHMKMYGKGNERRLTGNHETGHFETFSYGVANRAASVRIPRQAELDGCGYLEDRRPGANCDPYDVTSLIAKTTITDD